MAIAQFIIAQGLELSELRDELYCQLFKQVTKNPKVYEFSLKCLLIYVVRVQSKAGN